MAMYIFLPSYQTILFSLYQFRLDEMTYITYSPSVKKFAERIGIPVIYREEQTDLSLNGYREYKEVCLDIIEGWENREILFCFYTFDFWALYQLNILRKKNKVFFYNTDNLSKPGFDESNSRQIHVVNNSLINLFDKNYRKVFIKQLLFYYITGFYLDILEGDKGYFILGKSLKKCREGYLPFSNRNDEVLFKQNQSLILDKFNLQKIDVLFVDGGEDNIEIPASLIDTINEIMATLNLKMVIKAHPSFPLPAVLNAHQQVDRHLPVELLQGIPRVVLGLYSLGLWGFSANHPTISLINLVTFTSEYNKKKVLQIVGESNNILTPDSVDELKALLFKYLG